MTDKPVDLDKRRGWPRRGPPICGGCSRRSKPTRRSCDSARTISRPICSPRPPRPGRRLPRRRAMVLGLYAATLSIEDTRRRKLVAAVLEDFERLAREP